MEREKERMEAMRQEKVARANGTLESKAKEPQLNGREQEDNSELKKYPFKFVSKNHPSRRYKEYYNDGVWVSY